jgi:hypothetical protein
LITVFLMGGFPGAPPTYPFLRTSLARAPTALCGEVHPQCAGVARWVRLGGLVAQLVRAHA